MLNDSETPCKPIGGYRLTGTSQAPVDKVIYEPSIFDPLAYEYDRWFDEEGRIIFTIESRALRELLPSLSKPWLEMGVGSGRFAQALGIETGVDPSIELVHIARRRGINAFWGKGEKSLFDEDTFGTIFLIATLCFVDSPAAVLRETYRVLKAEGRIVLGLVLRESPWGNFYQAKKAEGHRFYKHATFYSYAEIVELLENAGFVPERTVSTLFQRPLEVKRIERPREGFHHDAGFTILVAKKRPVGEIHEH